MYPVHGTSSDIREHNVAFAIISIDTPSGIYVIARYSFLVVVETQKSETLVHEAYGAECRNRQIISFLIYQRDVSSVPLASEVNNLQIMCDSSLFHLRVLHIAIYDVNAFIILCSQTWYVRTYACKQCKLFVIRATTSQSIVQRIKYFVSNKFLRKRIDGENCKRSIHTMSGTMTTTWLSVGKWLDALSK